jgi:hypothetical protein
MQTIQEALSEQDNQIDSVHQQSQKTHDRIQKLRKHRALQR